MIFNPDKHKMGTLCIHNHEFEGTGQSVRLKNDGRCVVCYREKARQYRKANPENRWAKANPEYAKKWREANPDKAKESARQWYKANPERVRELSRKRYKANPEKVRETTRKYRESNPERARELVVRWQKANPERMKELNKAWRQSNQEKLIANRIKYYQANKDKINEASRKRRQAEAEIRKATKERISAIAKMPCEELRKKKRQQWENANRESINKKQRELYLKKNGGVIKTYVKQEPKTISEEIADLKKEAVEFNQLLAEIRMEMETA